MNTIKVKVQSGSVYEIAFNEDNATAGQGGRVRRLETGEWVYGDKVC
jgi:hypothetical protein